MRTGQAAGTERKPALVRASGLSKSYLLRAPFSRKRSVVEALKGVDLEVLPGCVTALVGESGCGKSTLARCLAFLERPDAGEIWFDEQEITAKKNLSALRVEVQLVFQDSANALNPRFSAAEIVAEPLAVQRRATGHELFQAACVLMEEVGLPAAGASRSPLEFSGGQRQRLAIARAMALRPKFLILDESLSGLDLIIQAQILDLLLHLQKKYSLTYLMISHDLALVGQVADFVAVMYRGQIVEHGIRQQIISDPQHEYTRRLLASIPTWDCPVRDTLLVGKL
jgi:ABC-type glutathione transport system ATPase component